ncbi:MAG: hypothetical protein JO202_13495 [Ktedonobacteraceae bacterium]|nr:hypothetical protein [Ktedonobacteraceae bacterium]
MQVLNNWCTEFQRDPSEIERAWSVSSTTSDAQRDDLVAAGASHFIVGMSGTWNDDAVANLVRWRDARNSK